MCQELINAEKISGGEAGWHASEGFASEASNPVASSSKHIYFYKKIDEKVDAMSQGPKWGLQLFRFPCPRRNIDS